tara:strand:+ start:2505 stop:4979 length:2475 start_codon:yes stop_codon:yes gene_type:complete
MFLIYAEYSNTMREDNYENLEEVKFVTKQMWKSMNILRGVIPAEHYHVYLFLLSAYYDGIISKRHIDFTNNLYDYINHSVEGKEKYAQVIDVYAPIIRSIPERTLDELLHQFSFFNIDILEENFEEIFDDLLFRLADSQGKFSGEFLLPYEISKVVMEMTNLPSGGSIYNPFAGLASFATHLENNQFYYGQEIVRSTWALGKLRLMRQNKNLNSNYVVEDSINNWSQNEKYDLVVSNPPFGLKINSHLSSGNYRYPKMNAEQWVLEKGLDSIKLGGQVICICSQGILYRGGSEAKMRERLVEKGYIDTIISLPGGLLKHTGIPICILILKNKRFPESEIRLVDGTHFVETIGRKEKRLNANKLLNYLKSSGNRDYLRYMPLEQVRDNKYNLSVQRYFADEFDGTPLKRLVKSISGERAGKDTFGKFIRTGNLKNDDVDYLLKIDKIEKRKLPVHSRKIEESCILISTRWKSLKPTLFEYKSEPIYIGIDILALEMRNSDLDSHYLISELNSKKVIKQVTAFQNLGAIQAINRADFFRIKINVPSIEEQRAKTRGILELSQKLKTLQEERNALVHGQQIKSFDEFASLKHSLGAPRQNILSNAKSLIRFFESNDTEAFNEVKDNYGKHYGTDLITDLIQIREDINHISVILEKGENGLTLDNYELETIPIQNINKLLKGLKRPNEKYSLRFDSLSATEMSGKAITANLTLFQILINNILGNASKYAFEQKADSNEVVVEMKATPDYLYLEIMNNGKPFPKNYNKEKFVTKFSTANPENGSGLGGYDINRIAEYFGNPDWELVLDENDVFPVVFKFNFPITPIVNE